MVTKEQITRGILKTAFKDLYEGKYSPNYSRITDLLNNAVKCAKKYVSEDVPDKWAFFSVPGRTELGGNHTDHNNGLVLASAVHLDTLAAVAPIQNKKIVLSSEGFDQDFIVDLTDLSPHKNEEGTTESIIRGIAAVFDQQGLKWGGFAGHIDSWVLPGSGLSSSAAFEVLLGTIFNYLHNGGELSSLELAKIAREAENRYFGKPCGLMDQLACAAGGVVKIDFGSSIPEMEVIKFNFNREGYRLAVINTGGSHSDLTAEYSSIPEEMGMVAQLFRQTHLRGISIEQLVAKTAQIRAECGDRAFLRAVHFLTENGRVKKMADALNCSDIHTYLKLVQQSGDSSWKLLQNCYQASLTENQPLPLYLWLSSYLLEGLPHAARVHGGGFAGTIQVYIPQEKWDGFNEHLLTVLPGTEIIELHVRNTGAVLMTP